MKEIYDDGKYRLVTLPCDDLRPPKKVEAICDRVLEETAQLTREADVTLSEEESLELEGKMIDPNSELWATLALKTGFPGNYKDALGGEFGLPAARYLQKTKGMNVYYWKAGDGYPETYDKPTIQVISAERLERIMADRQSANQ